MGRVLADPRQALPLQPFLQLRHVGVADRPRIRPKIADVRVGRHQERARQDRGARHFVEHERVGDLGRSAQRDHQVGENRKGASVIVTDGAGEPRRRLLSLSDRKAEMGPPP